MDTINKTLYYDQYQAELLLTYEATRLDITYINNDQPLQVIIDSLTEDKKVLEALSYLFQQLSETTLYGKLIIRLRHGKKGLFELIYNGCVSLLSLFYTLENSVGVSYDGHEMMATDPYFYIIYNEQGDIISMYQTQKQTILQLNEALSITSGVYDEIASSFQLQQQCTQEEKTIVIATKNKGKAREFASLFGQKGYQVKTLLDYPDIADIEETGATFEENARLKADTLSQLLNCPVLADDSGLCVDALHGQPGIHSARFASDHNDAANNAKLLSELAGVQFLDRTAHFHCTLVFSAPNKEDLVIDGEVEGLIATIPEGENGFGYDPLFYLPELDCTMAELTPEQKNQFSHRAVAVQKLSKQWETWLND